MAYDPEYHRQWYLTHREECLARAKARKNDPNYKKRRREATYRYRSSNPEKVKNTKRKILMKKFGITLERYEELLSKQGGVCAICGGPSGKRAYAVDHDHATGRVRGLLCSKCNTGLGQFRDSPQLLERAISYLKG